MYKVIIVILIWFDQLKVQTAQLKNIDNLKSQNPISLKYHHGSTWDFALSGRWIYIIVCGSAGR